MFIIMIVRQVLWAVLIYYDMSDMNMLGGILYDGGINDLYSDLDISIRFQSHAIAFLMQEHAPWYVITAP